MWWWWSLGVGVGGWFKTTTLDLHNEVIGCNDA
jgi:hypothetical protein